VVRHPAVDGHRRDFTVRWQQRLGAELEEAVAVLGDVTDNLFLVSPPINRLGVPLLCAPVELVLNVRLRGLHRLVPLRGELLVTVPLVLEGADRAILARRAR